MSFPSSGKIIQYTKTNNELYDGSFTRAAKRLKKLPNYGVKAYVEEYM